MTDGTNGLERINRNEFEQAVTELVTEITEMQEAFNVMKSAINAQAEILGCYRYIFENFFPIDRVAAAAKAYKDARQREIALATTPAAQA